VTKEILKEEMAKEVFRVPENNYLKEKDLFEIKRAIREFLEPKEVKK
jgi:hypothetical protein